MTVFIKFLPGFQNVEDTLPPQLLIMISKQGKYNIFWMCEVGVVTEHLLNNFPGTRFQALSQLS